MHHAGLFGSTTRDKAGPDSEIMIELDPYLPLSVYGYVGIKLFIEDLFEGPVDVVDRNSLKPYVKPNAIADLIDAVSVIRCCSSKHISPYRSG